MIVYGVVETLSVTAVVARFICLKCLNTTTVEVSEEASATAEAQTYINTSQALHLPMFMCRLTDSWLI